MQDICILVVSYDSGHYRERMGLGPDFLAAAIEPLLVRLGHTVRVERITLPPNSFAAEIGSTFALSREIARRVRELRDEITLPIVLSGNCNAALGTVSGCRDSTTSVIWFDAHGEATTPETTTSGFLDGMGISMLTGQCWQTLTRTVPGFEPLPGDRILLVGARDIEPAERDLLERGRVRQVAHPDDLFDAYAPLRLDAHATYLHFDLDVLDPKEATANGWPTPGGPDLDAVIRSAADVGRLSLIEAIGIASYDPVADRDGRALQAALAMLEAALHPPGRVDDGEPLTAREVLRRYIEDEITGYAGVALTDVNQIDANGDRPLHFAGWRGDAEEAAALIAGGAEVNAVGEFGYLPIHAAVTKGNIEVVRVLLEHGAFPDVSTEWGKTAIEEAREDGRQDLVELLMRYRRG